MDVEGYLLRIGQARPANADPKALRRLHAAHLRRVPFENLDIPLGVAVSLDPDALERKIVMHRRGGFCYELNGLFALLLSALGYEVTRLGASVRGGETWGPPMDHLALRVRCVDDSEWVADVGFGAHSLYPLRWELDVDQNDVADTFRLTGGDGGDVVVSQNGTPVYRLEARPRRLEEFDAMCWYQQHSPTSHFTRSVVCSRATDAGRISLSGDRLITTVDGERTETVLESDAEILDAYREHFGVELDRVPR